MVSQHSFHVRKHSPPVLALLEQQHHGLKQENYMPKICAQYYISYKNETVCRNSLIKKNRITFIVKSKISSIFDAIHYNQKYNRKEDQ